MPSQITMATFGNHGQWGNQVMQYAFLRSYAKRWGIGYQVPRWSGQFFFGHDDPQVSDTLPPSHERYRDVKHEPFGIPIPPGNEHIGKNFLGWAQYHGSYYLPDREFILSLFDTVEPTLSVVHPALEKLRSMGKTVVSIHLRRGDSGRLIFFYTPIAWCLQWLRENWARFDDPVLFLATETPSLRKWFTGYDVVLAEDLGIDFKGEPPPNYIYPYDVGEHRKRQLTFFPDWYLLQNSDVVLASESSFSYTAAWTSRVIKEYWRPRLSLRGFEQVDPWDSEVSPREHLDDFPGIPGTQIDTNEEFARYWTDFKATHPSVPENEEDIKALMEKP